MKGIGEAQRVPDWGGGLSNLGGLWVGGGWKEKKETICVPICRLQCEPSRYYMVSSKYITKYHGIH